MSVYTPLRLAQVQDFATAYGLSVEQITPIQGGIENTNYFVHCAAQDGSQQDYVLTLFEELDFSAASELAPVLAHLSAQGVPVAVPLQHDGAYIHLLAHKPAQLAPRMLGQHPMQPTVAQVSAIATAQAQIHMSLQGTAIQRRGNSNQQYWNVLAQQLQPTLRVADQSLLAQVMQWHQQWQQQHPNRPQGWIHADLFRDNSLFVGDHLSAILDFSELSVDDFLYDIAITLNDFATDPRTLALQPNRYLAYLQAYQQVRPLTADEHACLPIYLATAACRFWITRLQTVKRNASEGRTGQHILQKDPEEMRQMMCLRLAQVKNI